MNNRSATGNTQRGVMCDVRGRVQGVGFRVFVADLAESLGLSGYVRNSEDRRHVEVVAVGLQPALEHLIERLHVGPSMAHVENVTVTWHDAAALAQVITPGVFEVRH